MKSFVARCRLCGNDNLFPVKYAGRSLSCSHCGERLPVSAGDVSPVVAVTTPTNADPPSRETGLRRLMKAVCFALCLLCFVFLGAIGGAWAGLLVAVQFGFVAYVLLFITCPVGGLIGLFLAKWLGQGIARLMSSYRLAFPGLLLGMGGGVFYWTQKYQASPDRLLAGQLVWDEWLLLSVAAAIGGLLLGLVFMIFDALVNFTR